MGDADGQDPKDNIITRATQYLGKLFNPTGIDYSSDAPSHYEGALRLPGAETPFQKAERIRNQRKSYEDSHKKVWGS